MRMSGDASRRRFAQSNNSSVNRIRVILRTPLPDSDYIGIRKFIRRALLDRDANDVGSRRTGMNPRQTGSRPLPAPTGVPGCPGQVRCESRGLNCPIVGVLSDGDLHGGPSRRCGRRSNRELQVVPHRTRFLHGGVAVGHRVRQSTAFLVRLNHEPSEATRSRGTSNGTLVPETNQQSPTSTRDGSVRKDGVRLPPREFGLAGLRFLPDTARRHWFEVWFGVRFPVPELPMTAT